VSIEKPFGVFHLMQLIEKSIQVGALFSPKLYVPKEIWYENWRPVDYAQSIGSPFLNTSAQATTSEAGRCAHQD
jgi:hypothetical protein